MKKIYFLSFLIFNFAFLVTPIFAGNDLTIICPNSSASCQLSSPLPLLEETNLYPGFVKDPPQKLSIMNQKDTTCQLSFRASNLSGSELLAQNTIINIQRSGSTYFNNTVSSLENSYFSLDSIPPQSSQDYLWTVSLDRNLGNEFQNLSTVLDTDFNFTCADGVVSGASSNNSGGGNNNNSAPVCSNTAPLAASNFSVNPNLDGTVNLQWTHSASAHTGYLIAFGPTPENILYGNPDVGNVTNFTVQSLTPGAQYCFYVRSLNGCAPGDKTPTVCINTGSTVPAATNPPAGFQPNVLGTETGVEPSPTLNPSVPGEIKGDSTTCSRAWPYVFLLALLINLFYFYRQSKSSPPHKSVVQFIITLLVVGLAALVDYLLNRHCYYFPVVWALISFGFPYLYYFTVRLFGRELEDQSL